MHHIGIIAEFNPLHTGHEFLINEAKKLGLVTVCLSGNFVQRGDTAIYPKHIRTKAALLSGCDLVTELPVLWSMSTAQNFAFGAVSLLNSIGCDTIMFGSECGDISSLLSIAKIFENKDFSCCLEDELKKGITFAKARENAVKKMGGDYSLLKGANNNLAIEYICCARRINPSLNFLTVKRLGAMHDSKQKAKFVSASLLRENILKNNLREFSEYIPKGIKELYEGSPVSDIKRLECAILSSLRTKSIEQLRCLPDISEGLENKLYSAIRNSRSLDELFALLKVKRYTLARLRRLVLSAFLGFDNEFFKAAPPYLKILGFNAQGQEILKENAKASPIPVISRPADIKGLSGSAKKVFETEALATDLYNLSLNTPEICGSEYTQKIIKEL